MHLNSITEIKQIEINQVIGGVVHYRRLIQGGLIAGVSKMLCHYIEVAAPRGEKDTFWGEAWNGVVKLFSGIVVSVGLGLGTVLVTAAFVNQKNPAHQK